MGFGEGLIVAVLVAVIFPLLGLVNPTQAVSTVLVFGGGWAIIFGALANPRDRLYYLGWGVVAVAVSSFSVLPLQYTAVIIVVALIALTILSIMRRNKPKEKSA